MRVIRGINLLGSAKVTDTDLATDATTEWDTSAVSIGDLRKVTTTSNGAATATYKIYEAIAASTNKDPTVEMDPDNALYTSPGAGTNWKEVGTVAEWAWASGVYQDQASKNSSFYVEITPAQRVDSVFIGNADASEVNITVVSPSLGTLHDQDYNLTLPRGLGSWLRWFTEPFTNIKDYTVYNLPSAVDAVITVTISKGSNDAKAGVVLVGQSLTIGTSLSGAGFGLDDYTRATFLPSSGRTLITPRNYSRVSDVDVLVDRAKFQTMQQQLLSLRNTISVWTADNSDDGTSIMGILERYRTVISGPQKVLMNLRIKGVT